MTIRADIQALRGKIDEAALRHPSPYIDDMRRALDKLQPSPKRIQRKRTKGWRMPEGAVYVGRPTRWGNPWRFETPDIIDFVTQRPNDRASAIRNFERHIASLIANTPDFLAPLRGRDLACWCPLDQPCHADVLLELANG